MDSVSGNSIPDNVGLGSPHIHLHPVRQKGLRIRLMMKGGGCENVGTQYALPDTKLSAGRDLDGVRRRIIDAVHRAQGFGCAPGTVGVCIGGDRVIGYTESKEQLFRPLLDTNPDAQLDALEKEPTESLNSLNIGPMGWGGKTTILGVKIGQRARVPASFFVSVSYMCWAYRKGELLRDGEPLKDAPAPRPGLPLRVASERSQEVMPKKLELPISEAQVRELRVGDEGGVLRHPRHRPRRGPHAHAHAHALQARRHLRRHGAGPPSLPLRPGGEEGGGRELARHRRRPHHLLFEAETIEADGIRGIIGKGGMGPKTLAALVKHGAVYLHAVAGLAVVLGQCVTRVHRVHKLEELGPPEAMWQLEVKDFPAVIAMDSHGGSLHTDVEAQSAAAAARLMEANPFK